MLTIDLRPPTLPKPAPRRLPTDFVERLLARDESAYEELVRLHGPRMLAVATRYLPRAADAEDAVQEAFVDVVRSISLFRRASSFETWLHRVVVNRALTRLRTLRRKPVSTLEDCVLEGAAALSPWRSRPAAVQDTVADAEIASVVRRAIEGLPAMHRSVLMLRDVDGVSLQEIASLLDVGVSTVKTRVHRARAALQHALRPLLGSTRAPDSPTSASRPFVTR